MFAQLRRSAPGVWLLHRCPILVARSLARLGMGPQGMNGLCKNGEMICIFPAKKGWVKMGKV